MNKSLHRSQTDKILAGVCGGVAEYFGVDSTVVRLLFILIVMIGGSGVLLYALMWLLMPAGPKEEALITEEKIKEFVGELKEKAQEFKEEAKKRSNDADSHHYCRGISGGGRKFLGWFLLILGVAFLINNFVPSWMRLQMVRFWPLILIAAAVALIAGPRKEK